MPTPAVAHLTVDMRADAGIVISASHNPYDDNGVKVFGSDGFKLPDEAEAEIEKLVFQKDGLANANGKIGRADRQEDARGRYVVFAKRTFPQDLTLDGLKVVVDAANGAAYRVAPMVLAELGANVTAIGVKPNGININRECGAMYPDAVRAEVIHRGAHMGIALDGDADRVILVDEKGQVVDGDAVMSMCAARMLEDGSTQEGGRRDRDEYLGLERALEALGCKLVQTRVGDRYVVEEMRRGGYNLGGEQSGHLVFLDHASTGDGTVAACRCSRSCSARASPCPSSPARALERVPQVLHNVTLRIAKAARAPCARLAALQIKVAPRPPRQGRSRARAMERHRAEAPHHARGTERKEAPRARVGAQSRRPRRPRLAHHCLRSFEALPSI